MNDQFTEIADTLPRVPPDATLSPDELESCPDSFSNHGDVDQDEVALDIINGYIKRGWLAEFSTYEQLQQYVGGTPILNKFACLLKEKWDTTTGQWITKRRLIMDSKRSFVKEASNREYKSILPRVHDAASDVMALMNDAQPEQNVQMLVLDASEAYWNIPLRRSERRFYCGKLHTGKRSRYLAYTRTAQGSRGAPLAWAVVFSDAH